MATDTLSLSTARAELERAEAALRQQEEEVEKLRAFVEGFEAMLRRLGSTDGESAEPVQEISRTQPSNEVSAPVVLPEEPEQGLRVEDRAIRELEAVGTFLNTRELVERMVANGYTSGGTGKLTDTVYAILSYAAKKKMGSRLVKKNAKWGLREWQQT